MIEVVAELALLLAGQIAVALVALEALTAVGVPIALVVHWVAGQALHAFVAVAVVALGGAALGISYLL